MKNTIIAIISIALLTFVSCKDDEKKISNLEYLTSTKWELDKMSLQYTGITLDLLEILAPTGVKPVIYITFNSDSTYLLDDKLGIILNTTSASQKGTWQFTGSDNTSISLENSDKSENITLNIDELSYNDFKCETEYILNDSIDLSYLTGGDENPVFDVTLEFTPKN